MMAVLLIPLMVVRPYILLSCALTLVELEISIVDDIPLCILKMLLINYHQ